MPDRQAHQQEVRRFLQKQLSAQDWSFSLPRGTGMETYIAHGKEQDYFVKVGPPLQRYLAMAGLGLTPPVLACGRLESGPSILVQPFIAGHRPSQSDFWDQLEAVAELVRTMHNHPRIQDTLPPPSSNLHRDAGLQAMQPLRQRWERCKARVPNVARYVDDCLDYLARQISLFPGEGLAASHGDICNANWLFSGRKIYIVDLESMCMDDPALDLGALLWWYYPPKLRQRFLDIAGYRYDDELKSRMRIRMAMHCLHITLPRQQSFDHFDPQDYDESLIDFTALLAGEENPQGYHADIQIQ